MIGRTAFVIGGSGGLGSAICRAISPDWDQIRVGYRNGEAAAANVAAAIGAKAVPLRCDLSDAHGVRRAIDDAATGPGGLGAVIFAGGVPIEQPFVSTIEEPAWREVIETELIGFTRVVAAAIPHLRAAGGGAFVAVSSFANVHFPPGDALSSVPKAAIESLCRAVAKEEGRANIRANAVGPGIIDAGLGAEFMRDMYNPDIWEGQRRRVPLRRFGSAEEVAEAVAFLASERARYITGQTLIVDGGLSL
jgi:2-hydroxycyclohexanecarboxyl-CoA dehydrogenase